ncbi:nephrin [Copidosoma floridanum]|uniref:nephrin n=1 Tax=Copidosoma floridanum TaxID=29053 RepID=UPI0006C9C421|nr:nephrin [Copidosoma floridanum]
MSENKGVWAPESPFCIFSCVHVPDGRNNNNNSSSSPDCITEEKVNDTFLNIKGPYRDTQVQQDTFSISCKVGNGIDRLRSTIRKSRIAPRRLVCEYLGHVGPLQLARAVLDGTAELPCDVSTPSANDSFILVVWYRQDIIPIYSYDIRGKNLLKPSEWMVEYLNHRTSFQTNRHPATLNIEHVTDTDAGEYRCRVDFKKNPTRNSRVNLTIIIPPSKPRIINQYGDPVESMAGPFTEGGDMQLKCLVSGGNPVPTVRWWRDGMLLEAKDEASGYPNVRQNLLVVKNLSRADLHARFECQASNNNISMPISTHVAIEIHLRPLKVTINTDKDTPLSAGRKYELNCVSVGSRPSATVTWFMDNQRLTNYTSQSSKDGNVTSSILTFTPQVEDNGKLITCRAENSHIPGAVEEGSLKLNVYYVPTLNLKLGASMNPNDIEEDDDVYFECQVNANPPAYKVIWKHNGNVLQNNAKQGMIVQMTSLALRKVKRSQAGNYSCTASNVEGDGFSNNVELKIMYKPICLPEQKRIYGVARHEEARIFCKVEAYPAPDKFRWAFNSTEEMANGPDARHEDSTDLAQSVLTYKPASELDYGTVSCWASNAAGQQKTPCVFHIIAAGKPEPPYNCTLTNQTTQSLSVECTAGFDGGQTQHFQLEVYDQHSGQLRANVSARDSATFGVYNLEPGRVLRMAVYAVNSKGRSDPALLEGFTLKVAEKQTGVVRVLFTGTPVPFEMTPILGILVGVISVLLLCTVMVLLALKVRSDRRAQRPGDLPLKKATAPSSEDLYDADDRNPDVVPTNKDSDYQLTGSTAGTPLAVQTTPDSTTSLTGSQQPNHLPTYSSHNDYNNYPTLPLSGEVTYAELCLPRPSALTTAAGADAKLASLGGLSSLAGFGNNGTGVIIGGKHQSPSYPKEATVYACIDHNARPPVKQIDQLSPPGLTIATPGTPPINSTSLLQHQDTLPLKAHQHPPPPYPREVVTVRTPLISSQESCV